MLRVWPLKKKRNDKKEGACLAQSRSSINMNWMNLCMNKWILVKGKKKKKNRKRWTKWQLGGFVTSSTATTTRAINGQTTPWKEMVKNFFLDSGLGPHSQQWRDEDTVAVPPHHKSVGTAAQEGLVNICNSKNWIWHKNKKQRNKKKSGSLWLGKMRSTQLDEI